MPDTPQAARIFVSHSHEDDAFCQRLVTALRSAGADVWYDEHNLDSGPLLDTIERELRARPIFVLVLSPAALTSQWVHDECTWAFTRVRRDPTRIILPVLVAQLADADDIWMFLQNFKRIEAPGTQPFPVEEAVRRTLRALALTPAGEAPAPTAPQSAESVEDLINRGKALRTQGKHAEALLLFERASQLAPTSFDVWFQDAYTLDDLERFSEALAALDRALIIEPGEASAWNNKGNILRRLYRPNEALDAYERALALDPNYGSAWNNKGLVLWELKRTDEALDAFERATVLDPLVAKRWENKIRLLGQLGRTSEADIARKQWALADASSWNLKGTALFELGRYDEALAAFDLALVNDPNNTNMWNLKGAALFELRRYYSALAAYDNVSYG